MFYLSIYYFWTDYLVKCAYTTDVRKISANITPKKYVIIYTKAENNHISEFKQGKALQLWHRQIFNFKKDVIVFQCLSLTPEPLFLLWSLPASALTEPVTAPGPSQTGPWHHQHHSIFNSKTVKISYFHVPLQISLTSALTEEMLRPWDKFTEQLPATAPSSITIQCKRLLLTINWHTLDLKTRWIEEIEAWRSIQYSKNCLCALSRLLVWYFSIIPIKHKVLYRLMLYLNFSKHHHFRKVNS